MTFDSNFLEKIIKSNQAKSSNFQINVNNLEYSLKSVTITNTLTPVNEPTTRGGVYFSDKFAYKMKGVIEDLSVVPHLTKKMLGPNTEFGRLKISTTMDIDGQNTSITFFTNLTNSVQTPNSIELSMVIVDLIH